MVEQAHISHRTVNGYMALFRKTTVSFSVLLDLSDIELKAAFRETLIKMTGIMLLK